MALQRIFAFILLTSLGAGPVYGEDASPLRSGWDIARSRALLGGPQPPFSCPPPVPPVVDMTRFQSRYDPNDPTQSLVDPKREASQAGRDKRLGEFVNALSRLGDRYVLTKPESPAIARCAFEQLLAWAADDALLGSSAENDENGRHQAIMTQAWQLSTIAAAYLRISDAAEPSPAEASDLRRWLKALATPVIAEYEGDNRWTRHGANHLYWAGVAVGFTGVALQDRAMLDFARRALARGLADVDDRGALTKEMERGGRSLIYQNFATLALATLLRLTVANEMKLSGGEEAAFERLIAFNVDQARDPAEASRLAKAPQAAANDRSSLAWIDVALPWARIRNAPLAERLEGLADSAGARPAWHVYLGGDASAVFNPENRAGRRAGENLPAVPR